MVVVIVAQVSAGVDRVVEGEAVPVGDRPQRTAAQDSREGEGDERKEQRPSEKRPETRHHPVIVAAGARGIIGATALADGPAEGDLRCW